MEILEKISHLKRDSTPFALATVVRVVGSASARAGAKAIFSESGKNIMGWVGGGCAEAVVARNALEAMGEGAARVVEVDLDDEIFGAGIACGGKMEVYIEPYGPASRLRLAQGIALSAELQHIGNYLGHVLGEGDDLALTGFHVAKSATAPERMLLQLAEAIARSRGFSWRALRLARSTGGPWGQPRSDFSRLLLLGRGRIVEELARLAVLASWPVKILGSRLDPSDFPAGAELEAAQDEFANFSPSASEYIVFASHHPADPGLLAKSLRVGVPYAGFVASEKRTRKAQDHLKSEQLNLGALFAPAGVELGAQNPAEIALSIFAEMIWLRRSEWS